MKKYLFLFCLLAGITSCSLQDDPSANNKLNAPDLAAIATKASAINSYAQIVNGPITGLVPIDLRPPVDVIDIADSTGTHNTTTATVVNPDTLINDAVSIAISFASNYDCPSELFGSYFDYNNVDINNYFFIPTFDPDTCLFDNTRFISENTSAAYQSMILTIVEAFTGEGDWPSIDDIANSTASDMEKIVLAIQFGLLNNESEGTINNSIDEVLTKTSAYDKYRQDVKACEATWSKRKKVCTAGLVAAAGGAILLAVVAEVGSVGTATPVLLGLAGSAGTAAVIAYNDCMSTARGNFDSCKRDAYDRWHKSVYGR